MKLNNKGVTLIALVVTIIVLLILAGVAIATLTGEDGIITNAQKAQVATVEAEVVDRMNLAYSSLKTEATIKMSTEVGYKPVEHIEELAQVVAKELGVKAQKEEVAEVVTDGKYHVYYQESGTTITMLYGDNRFALKAGSVSKNNLYANIRGVINLSTTGVTYTKEPKNNLYANIRGVINLSTTGVTYTKEPARAEENAQNPSQGEIMVENREYKDSEGKIAIIPKGFCVVKGTDPISKGLVISDVENDDMENSKGGNQFVWIPVDGENLKYEQHKYAEPNADDHERYLEDTGNGKWKTYQYRHYKNEWEDTNGKAESVAQNKGFYVGRYEAGIPKEAPFYSDEDGSTYWQQAYSNNDLGENSLTQGDYANTCKDKNVTTYKPVSKKNTPSWNYIGQINAKEVSSKMYGEEKGVTSQLIDSYAYDTIAQWLSNSSYNVTNSTSWGNYVNADYEINGLYAKHEGKNDSTNTWRLYPAYTWSKGTYSKKNGDRFEIATGSIERNKANNIYDFAGNMSEWTTETRTDGNSSIIPENMFAVIRGGGFYSIGNSDAMSFRYGITEIVSKSFSIGFRIVLYIK